jgi:hypothetical protein
VSAESSLSLCRIWTVKRLPIARVRVLCVKQVTYQWNQVLHRHNGAKENECEEELSTLLCRYKLREADADTICRQLFIKGCLLWRVSAPNYVKFWIVEIRGCINYMEKKPQKFFGINLESRFGKLQMGRT